MTRGVDAGDKTISLNTTFSVIPCTDCRFLITRAHNLTNYYHFKGMS